jgi:MFS family permease
VQYKHVSPAAVATILAVGDIAITLLEIPTGRFADRFGYRCSLITGSAVQVIGMLLCWLAEGIPGLVLASLCVALGDTFRSGADQALLYESCAATGQPERFQQIEAKTHSLELIALVAMMLVGGVVVETAGFSMAWLLETGLAAAGVFLALTMVEPPSNGLANISQSARTIGGGGLSTSRAPLQGCQNSLLRLIVPAALVGGAAGALAFRAQTGGQTDPIELTGLVTLITLAEAAGAWSSRYLRPRAGTQYVILALGVAVSVAVFIENTLFVSGVLGLSVLRGVAEPLRATAIQGLVESRRAEAASWANAVDGAVRTVSLLIAGAVPRRRR